MLYLRAGKKTEYIGGNRILHSVTFYVPGIVTPFSYPLSFIRSLLPGHLQNAGLPQAGGYAEFT